MSLAHDVKTHGPYPCQAPNSRTATALARCLARVLASSHDRGVIVRDLTPGNVVVTDGEAMIVDLGHGALDGVYPEGGTPGYMLVRQVRNETPLDTDDFYAFVMLLLFTVAAAPRGL